MRLLRVLIVLARAALIKAVARPSPDRNAIVCAQRPGAARLL